jgi:prepilin-type processing-associated H-X9-DG protein
MNYVGNGEGPGLVAYNRYFSGTIVPNTWTVQALPPGYKNYGSTPGEWNGAANNFGPIGIENIRDGTSNTGLFSERLVGMAGDPDVLRSSPDFKRAIYTAPSSVPGRNAGPAGALQFIQACNSLPGTTISTWSDSNQICWTASYPWYYCSNGYNHMGPPNSTSCNNPNEYFGTWITSLGPSGSAPPNSNHPGGVNLCFADGSVKFVKDTVGLQPWWAIGTRNGGEIVSSDSY